MTLNHKHIISWIFLLTISLVVIHVVLQYIRWELGFQHLEPYFSRLDLDNEASIPTWFSQTLFLYSSLLLLLIANHYRKVGLSFSKHWLFLSGLFLFLSIDDGAMLHETTNEPVRAFLSSYSTNLYLDNAWVYLFSIFLIILTLAYGKFLWQLNSSTRIRFIIAGIVFVSGAIITELFTSQFGGFEYKMIVALEEGLELIGAVLFIRALMLHLKYLNVKVINIELR